MVLAAKLAVVSIAMLRRWIRDAQSVLVELD
jgi:hypothetical protein